MVTSRQNRTTTLGPGQELGLGMLIMETDDGRHEPVAVVSTINEACEIADHDVELRMRDLESGGEPACPHVYKVWAQDEFGRYRVVTEIEM